MKTPAKLHLAAMILCALALTACGPERPRIALPPADLASCADEPLAPDLPGVNWATIEAAKAASRARDTATLGFILSLRSAWGDCKSKVDGLKAWRDRVGG